MTARQPDRPKSPHKYEIALYWHERETEFVLDLGEPACFACGWCDDHWPRSEPDDTEAKMRRLWKATTGLQICHLVPYSQGGSSEVSNLVLLCDGCHRAAPDFGFPNYMLAWMRSRQSWSVPFWAGVTSATEEAFRAYGRQWPPADQDVDEIEAATSDPDFWRFYKKTVTVSPECSYADRMSTIVAALHEYTCPLLVSDV